MGVATGGLGPVGCCNPRTWPVVLVASSIWVSTAMAILSGRLLEQMMLEVNPMPLVCTPKMPPAAFVGGITAAITAAVCPGTNPASRRFHQNLFTSGVAAVGAAAGILL